MRLAPSPSCDGRENQTASSWDTSMGIHAKPCQPKNHRRTTAHIAAIGTSIGVSKVNASPIVIMVRTPTNSLTRKTKILSWTGWYQSLSKHRYHPPYVWTNGTERNAT